MTNLPDLILTPKQVIERAEDYIGRSIAMRGFMLVDTGTFVDETLLIVEFETVLVQSDLPNNEMYKAIDASDFAPSAFLMISSPGFGKTMMDSDLPEHDLASNWLIALPVVISAKLRESNHTDPAAKYELFDPEWVYIEEPEQFGKIIPLA